jgi:hypothetical protein
MNILQVGYLVRCSKEHDDIIKNRVAQVGSDEQFSQVAMDEDSGSLDGNSIPDFAGVAKTSINLSQSRNKLSANEQITIGYEEAKRRILAKAYELLEYQLTNHQVTEIESEMDRIIYRLAGVDDKKSSDLMGDLGLEPKVHRRTLYRYEFR